MDAVEFLVTRDRMCGSFNGRCAGCEVNERMGAGEVCIHYMAQHPQEVVEIVERWGKEHPRKTRQSEFLKMFPRVKIERDAIKFCPADMDSDFRCQAKEELSFSCATCKRKFWLEEVEDDD